jgi:hypothetical protein
VQCENAAFSYSETNNNSLQQNAIFLFQRVESTGRESEKETMRNVVFSKENIQNTALLCILARKIEEEKPKQKDSLKCKYLPS